MTVTLVVPEGATPGTKLQHTAPDGQDSPRGGACRTRAPLGNGRLPRVRSGSVLGLRLGAPPDS